MRFVHLSDLHHQLDWGRHSLWRTGWRGLPGRVELHGLGRLGRFRHAAQRIDGLLEDLDRLGADHVLVTGDLTALGHDEELERVHAQLEPLLEAGRLTLVPGNHDRYVDGGHRRFERVFGARLKSDLPQHAGPDGYPFVRLLGERLAVVGLDSTRVKGWTHYFFGRVGQAQLERLERLLDDPALAGRTVLLLSHHGPLGPGGGPHWRESGLLDGAKLLALIRGRPVVLHHGHSHQRYWHRADAPRPHIFGGGSSTETGREGYWVIDVDDHRRLEARAYRPGGRPVD